MAAADVQVPATLEVSLECTSASCGESPTPDSHTDVRAGYSDCMQMGSSHPNGKNREMNCSRAKGQERVCMPKATRTSDRQQKESDQKVTKRSLMQERSSGDDISLPVLPYFALLLTASVSLAAATQQLLKSMQSRFACNSECAKQSETCVSASILSDGVQLFKHCAEMYSLPFVLMTYA